jgi:hypothetical protein
MKRSLCLIGDGDEERDEPPDMDRIRRRSKSGSIIIYLVKRIKIYFVIEI